MTNWQFYFWSDIGTAAGYEGGVRKLGRVILFSSFTERKLTCNIV